MVENPLACEFSKTHTVCDAFDEAWAFLKGLGSDLTQAPKSLATQTILAKRIIEMVQKIEGANDLSGAVEVMQPILQLRTIVRIAGKAGTRPASAGAISHKVTFTLIGGGGPRGGPGPFTLLARCIYAFWSGTSGPERSSNAAATSRRRRTPRLAPLADVVIASFFLVCGVPTPRISHRVGRKKKRTAKPLTLVSTALLLTRRVRTTTAPVVLSGALCDQREGRIILKEG